jgi:hypothetical protein
MRKMPETYYGRGAFAETAAFMRGVSRMWNNLFLDGVRAEVVPFESVNLWSDRTRAGVMPFDLASVAMGGSPSVPTVTLVAGDVEIHGETQAGTTTTYKTVSPLTVTLTGSGTEYVWIEMTWSGSAWETPVFATGASKPNDAAKTYRRLLWKFVDGAPTTQYHRGNVEFVGFRQEEA